MREIKFRAWDTITNRMHDSIEELYFEDGVLIEVIFKKSWNGVGSCAEQIIEWQYVDKTILMQYIGLKDKNGVEIYEKDIISDKYHSGEVYYLDEKNGNIGAFGWGGGEDWGMIFSEDVVVVGNIYEKTELVR